jgi:hypothetical protein
VRRAPASHSDLSLFASQYQCISTHLADHLADVVPSLTEAPTLGLAASASRWPAAAAYHSLAPRLRQHGHILQRAALHGAEVRIATADLLIPPCYTPCILRSGHSQGARMSVVAIFVLVGFIAAVAFVAWLFIVGLASRR